MGSALVDEPQLTAWGREFARTLPRPAVVALSGELGAGKTTLVRAMSEELGVKEPVTSPTFALVHRYAGDHVSIYHVDAYRLRPDDEAGDLGFDDMLADPSAIVLIEWADRLGEHAPPVTHHIQLAYANQDDQRYLEWS